MTSPPPLLDFFNILTLLLEDSDPEIRTTAGDTLNRIPEAVLEFAARKRVVAAASKK